LSAGIAHNEAAAALRGVGLSEQGVLSSTGTARHVDRLAGGEVSAGLLLEYAGDLGAITQISRECGSAIPVDFWDVRTSEMVTAGMTEYSLARRLVRDCPDYVRLLGNCWSALIAMRIDRSGTAVSTSLSILRNASNYAAAGGPMISTESRPSLSEAQRAVYLWQQIVSGTNRQIPYLRRDAYSHGMWARMIVVELWRYHVRATPTVDEVWGLTGFSQRFIGDGTNTNQVEHMAISAVAQCVLRIPVFVLDLVEELEWILRKGTHDASRADERVNGAVARFLLRDFRVNDPDPACARLEAELAS
jgi:hypothetical protein